MEDALHARAWLWVAIPTLWALAYLPNLGVRPLRLEEGRRAAPARAKSAGRAPSEAFG